MKRIERHKLKENDFAHSVARTREMVMQRQREVTTLVIAIVTVVLAIGGYAGYRGARNSKSTTLLATALATAEAPVIAPPPPAPGSPPPVQAPGTFRTERERLDASLPLLQRAADGYPDTDAGITARFRLAATLAELERHSEAEQRYKEVIDKTSRKNIYHDTARLGAAQERLAQGRADEAMSALRDLATDTQSQLPADGVLMQLGHAALAAGKHDEATRAFTRVVDEFPQSPYASEAKEQVAAIKKA
jgi:hypothetical protein